MNDGHRTIVGVKDQPGCWIKGGRVDMRPDRQSRDDLSSIGIGDCHELVVAADKKTPFLPIDCHAGGSLAWSRWPAPDYLEALRIHANQRAFVLEVHPNTSFFVVDRKLRLASKFYR